MKKVILLQDKGKVDELIKVFFDSFQGIHFKRAIRAFANKSYYGENVIFIFFKQDFDEYDSYEMDYILPYPLDNEHVLLEFSLLGSDKVELAYIDFSTFYHYVYEQALLEQEKNPSLELLPLVKELRLSLLGE